MKVTKTIITITATEHDDRIAIDVKSVFEPSAKTKGPMTHDQYLGMVAMKAIKNRGVADGAEPKE